MGTDGTPNEDHEGCTHEGDESDESDEGSQESHEESNETKESVKNCKGKNMKAVVFRGGKEKTKTGLTKAHLIKNKAGRIVTKKASAAGKRNYKNIQAWTKAVQQARKALGLTGFCAVNGKTAQGKALYAKAKAIHQGA